MGQCQQSQSNVGAEKPSVVRTSSGRMIARDLSAFECLSWKATPYASIAHWFQVEGPASQQDVAAALGVVYRKFASLQSTIQQKRLVLRPDLEPEIRILEHADVTLKALAQLASDEASRGLAPSREACEGQLLWRACVLPQGWVMLTFHHAIIDEYSIGILMRTFLQVLAGTQESIPQKVTLEPKLTQMLDEPKASWLTKLAGQRGGGRLPGIAAGRLANMALKPRSKTASVPLREGKEWPKPEATANWQDRKTRACCRVLEISQTLRQICRDRGVTVNATLIAGLALALRRRMSKTGPVRMRPMLAVDVRRHIPNSQDLFGCYSLGVYKDTGSGRITVGQDTLFWDVAIQASQLVQDASRKPEALNISWYLRFFASAMGKKEVAWVQTAMDLDGPDQGRVNALLVSNTGILQNLEVGPYRVAQSFFMSHQAAWGPFVWLNTSSIGEKLFLTLCYIDPLMSESQAELMMTELVYDLTEAVGAPKQQAASTAPCSPMPTLLEQGTCASDQKYVVTL
eukprot:TRINITY_DN12935_c0_g1_i2.p1 TRINITY_DN12935_c0_g1~~TRINITY_DN12935_c0_g1_i2.p1  ORF type:complete len:515 (+),score=61.78 TRINITY_DN12935_c0_g1_i2:63-1607(+)